MFTSANSTSNSPPLGIFRYKSVAYLPIFLWAWKKDNC